MAEVNYIRPQEGYQLKTLATPADIVIGGGAAGVGKTFTLLLEPLRYKDVEGYGGVILDAQARRLLPKVRYVIQVSLLIWRLRQRC